ncbi:UPF0016-domain-containing protein [Bimuria novae-zelandiae CBS 107.79]|uniref:UPF0016-domain-containing protein n=1 Tax=Bimuria novae-zelandiae CBS 107.79 TaxID=1447943 RepID=A0A6A5UWJ7_9PLEO|nr:UPF0016-domain-containing protein [Bimuria novae-zelandiae CBS 107.79]
MRLRQPQATALLLLLPAVQVLSAKVLADADSTKVARVTSSEIATATGAPDAVAALSPKQQGTKDAPVDGFDGKPHAGPYVDEKTVTTKKGPGGIEELRPGSRKPTSAEKEELAAKIEKDDSVMNDPDRQSPKGNTGTEGGVSAKDKERLAQEGKTGEKVEKVPEPPKEAPELPTSHGDQQRLKDKQEASKDGKDADGETRVLGAQGLEKPTDLPESPHDIPHPIPPSSEKTNPLDTTPKTGTSAMPEDQEAGGVIQPFHSFVLSLTMIIFSEIGDKTFLVAALMAMRHPRILVFSAAFSALIVMTVLSAVLGHAVPTLIPERFTHLAAAVLFLVFGVKLMREGLAMSPDEGVGEEMREVEQELEEKESLARQQKGGRKKSSSISPYVLESGRARRSRSQSRLPAPARSPSSSPDRAPSPGGSSLSSALSGLNNLFSLLLSPAWVQTFVMTFLGEWGDRSQIATVAMAAGSDYWWVTGGAIFGHGLCTAGAVIGGRAIAGKVSMRVVTLGGAIAFLVFGVIYLFEAMYHE